jgi:hypothetical protein
MHAAVQKEIDTLGIAQFPGIKDLHRGGHRFLCPPEELGIETAANDLDPILFHAVQIRNFPALIAAEGDDPVDAPTLGQDPTPQACALHELSEIG